MAISMERADVPAENLIVQFKKKEYKILQNVGYQKKLDAGVELVTYGTVFSDTNNDMYQTVDFELVEALVVIKYFTNIKIDLDIPPEKAYKLYDELYYTGVIDKVYNVMDSEIQSVRACYRRQFEIVRSRSIAGYAEKKDAASFGTYAKRLLESFLGDGDYKALMAESTGMINGLSRVMNAYRAESANQENEDRAKEYGKLINLSKREEKEE